MSLRFFNTLGRMVQDFMPVTKGRVGFYGCGPTVYNYAHIGNLRAYVFLDTLDRTFTFLGWQKTHVMNITDIGHLSGDNDDGEDKMVHTARERGQSVLEIARVYTDAFFADSDRLNILRPDVVCKATEHVPEMIDLIRRLEDRGHTYRSGGNLYYDVGTFPDYGKLAGLNLDDLKAGARIDVDANKRNPADFALWFTKSKFENQALVWDSPWGTGYPGWHIECSAMSMKYLGEHFDIHTGGIDHIPVHHTNEIAQSEGATGKKWVNYWLHNEFLVIPKDRDSGKDGAGKMSKSAGNFLTLQALIDSGYDPLDYRFFLLGAHYRSQIAFSWDAMDSARNARRALVQRLSRLITQMPGSSERADRCAPFLTDFREALENDLAMPRALSVLQAALRDRDLSPGEKLSLASRMDDVLGLDLLRSARAEAEKKHSPAEVSVGAGGGVESAPGNAQIDVLVAERNAAKKAKNYARADEIRVILREQGIVLEDTPSGTLWHRE
ncbi:MAG: cysteine--tRNA ligase [Spirochaetaceae bacterium]|nr:cysteine--tRNA ligase [Spirochaetaceae bacterium]